MASISSLQDGDCVVCRINGNYASGRVFIKNGAKYLANNDYSFADTPESTKEERHDYRLAFPLNNSLVTDIKKVSYEKLPYKTGDFLQGVSGDIRKVLARSGSIHFLSVANDFDRVDEDVQATRKELDEAGVTRYIPDCQDQEEVPELTMEEICRALGRTVKIRK